MSSSESSPLSLSKETPYVRMDDVPASPTQTKNVRRPPSNSGFGLNTGSAAAAAATAPNTKPSDSSDAEHAPAYFDIACIVLNDALHSRRVDPLLALCPEAVSPHQVKLYRLFHMSRWKHFVAAVCIAHIALAFLEFPFASAGDDGALYGPAPWLFVAFEYLFITVYILDLVLAFKVQTGPRCLFQRPSPALARASKALYPTHPHSSSSDSNTAANLSTSSNDATSNGSSLASLSLITTANNNNSSTSDPSTSADAAAASAASQLSFVPDFSLRARFRHALEFPSPPALLPLPCARAPAWARALARFEHSHGAASLRRAEEQRVWARTRAGYAAAAATRRDGKFAPANDSAAAAAMTAEPDVSPWVLPLRPWAICRALCVLLLLADLVMLTVTLATARTTAPPTRAADDDGGAGRYVRLSRPLRLLLLISRMRRLRSVLTAFGRAMAAIAHRLLINAFVLCFFAFFGFLVFASYSPKTPAPSPLFHNAFDSLPDALYYMFMAHVSPTRLLQVVSPYATPEASSGGGAGVMWAPSYLAAFAFLFNVFFVSVMTGLAYRNYRASVKADAEGRVLIRRDGLALTHALLGKLSHRLLTNSNTATATAAAASGNGSDSEPFVSLPVVLRVLNVLAPALTSAAALALLRDVDAKLDRDISAAAQRSRNATVNPNAGANSDAARNTASLTGFANASGNAKSSVSSGVHSNATAATTATGTGAFVLSDRLAPFAAVGVSLTTFKLVCRLCSEATVEVITESDTSNGGGNGDNSDDDDDDDDDDGFDGDYDGAGHDLDPEDGGAGDGRRRGGDQGDGGGVDSSVSWVDAEERVLADNDADDADAAAAAAATYELAVMTSGGGGSGLASLMYASPMSPVPGAAGGGANGENPLTQPLNANNDSGAVNPDRDGTASRRQRQQSRTCCGTCCGGPRGRARTRRAVRRWLQLRVQPSDLLRCRCRARASRAGALLDGLDVSSSLSADAQAAAVAAAAVTDAATSVRLSDVVLFPFLLLLCAQLYDYAMFTRARVAAGLPPFDPFAYERTPWGAVSLALRGLFLVEVAVKLWALGLKRFWARGMNRIDFIVTFVSVTGGVLAHAAPSLLSQMHLILAARSVRVLRMLSLTTGATRFFKTVGRVFPALAGVALVFLFLIFAFALIAVDLLGGPQLDPTRVAALDDARCCGEWLPHRGVMSFESLPQAILTGSIIAMANWWTMLIGPATVVRGWVGEAFITAFRSLIYLIFMPVFMGFVMEAFNTNMQLLEQEENARAAAAAKAAWDNARAKRARRN